MKISSRYLDVALHHAAGGIWCVPRRTWFPCHVSTMAACREQAGLWGGGTSADDRLGVIPRVERVCKRAIRRIEAFLRRHAWHRRTRQRGRQENPVSSRGGGHRARERSDAGTGEGADLDNGCPSTLNALFFGAWYDWAGLHNDLIQQELLLFTSWVGLPACLGPVRQLTR